MSFVVVPSLHRPRDGEPVYLVGWWWKSSESEEDFVFVIAGSSKNLQGNFSESNAFGFIGRLVQEGCQLADETIPVLVEAGISGDIANVFVFGSARFAKVLHYAPPRTRALQYMSIKPLILDLSLAHTIMSSSPSGSSPVHVQISRYVNKLSGRDATAADGKKKEKAIFNNMMGHVWDSQADQIGVARMDFEQILQKINQAHTEVQRINYPWRVKLVDAWRSSCARIALQLLTLMQHPILVILFSLRSIAETLTWILHRRVIGRNATKDLLTAGYQLNLRLQQACFWPGQYLEWIKSENKLSPICQAQYIGFYNVVWLIVNDIIIGMTLGTLVILNRKFLASAFIDSLDYYTLDGLKFVIDWLMGWPPPVGLKLNSELNGFLGQLFLWIIYLWRDVIRHCEDQLPVMFYAIGLTGYLGATMVLSLLSDLVALSTMHLYLFYIVSTKIFGWQIDALSSLLTIFRGKKLNVLRNRVDFAEFDVDQLLVGAILFTLLGFLVPTVVVYYLLFSITRICVIWLQGAFELLLAFLNHFPLFSIMLRIKDPRRLPDGIQIRLLSWTKGIVYMSLQSVPVGISAIFFQYRYIIDRLIFNYANSTVTKNFVFGRVMEQVPKLQYPTFPEANFDKFPDFANIWKSLRNSLCIREE